VYFKNPFHQIEQEETDNDKKIEEKPLNRSENWS